RMIEVKTNEAKAVVIDRCMFDNICCEAAKEADATISTSSKVLDFKRDGNELSVKCLIDGDKKEVRTKLLIGADGYKSQVGSYAGLGCAKEIVRGIQADLEYQMPEQDMVEVYLGKDI